MSPEDLFTRDFLKIFIAVCNVSYRSLSLIKSYLLVSGVLLRSTPQGLMFGGKS